MPPSYAVPAVPAVTNNLLPQSTPPMQKNFRGERILLFVESDNKGLLVESSNGYRLQQIINDYKVVIFYPLVDAPIRSTVVLDQKLIVLQRTLSSQL